MIQAPFQLQDYWVDFIQVRASQAYSPKIAPDLDFDSIELKSDVRSLEVEHPEKNGTLWLVNLVINQHLPKGKNIPYEFSLDVTGLVAAHPSLKGEKLERLIKANGPSMLFGSAREIIRAATGRGPFAPVIIPSTNFLGHLPEKEPEKQKKPARTTRKAVKKKTAKKSLPVAKRAKEKSDSQ